MAISQQEIEAILADASKQVVGDIAWTADVDHSPAREFRIQVQTNEDYPLFAMGRYNSFSGSLSYAFILGGTGRVYALDLGKNHRNLDGIRVGEKHKHRWRNGLRDKCAYVPDDITATWTRPLEVWEQFCREARLQHDGVMHTPWVQEEAPL